MRNLRGEEKRSREEKDKGLIGKGRSVRRECKTQDDRNRSRIKIEGRKKEGYGKKSRHAGGSQAQQRRERDIGNSSVGRKKA